MSKIELGRYSELLRRALGMKGVVEVAGELSPEVSATWEIEADRAEWQFLKGVRLVTTGGGQGASVGNNFIGRLVNPAASGIIASISLVSLSADAISAYAFRFQAAPLGNLASVAESGARDSRWGSPGVSRSPLVASSTVGALPTTGFLLHTVRAQANQEIKFTVPLVMTPGSILLFSNTTVNVLTVFSIHWSERGFPELEQ